jgi:ABC-type nitrate/sulfonate/bicarbonate transport system substrate-binding protein
MKRHKPVKLLLVIAAIVAFLSTPPSAGGQEKKLLRIVFVSLSWNNQLPFRVAMARGFFKDQGLTIEPIFVAAGRPPLRLWSPEMSTSPVLVEPRRL